MDLYTIGHSTHPIDRFLQLLDDWGIQCLVDVRTTPYSRFNPQFNRSALQNSLTQRGIKYVYLGNELGGRPSDPSCYIPRVLPAKSADYLHEIDYAEVMKRPWFLEGIRRLLELAGTQPTVILCSEGDPAKCHRHHLIASYLLANRPEVAVKHILKDGSLIDARGIKRVEAQGRNLIA